MKRKQIISTVTLVLLVQACLCNNCNGGNGNGNGNNGGSQNGGETEPGTSEQAIGQITKERSQVRAGPSSAMKEVTNTRDLNNNDAVNVSGGGKAILNFNDGIRFTLFNDSSVDGIQAELDPDTPPRLAWKVIRGGGSGQVVEPGAELEISVVTGTKITILGTRFFFVYDDDIEILTIGKFDGSLAIEIPGQEEFFLGEEVVDIASDGSTQYHLLPFDQDVFDDFADEYNSSQDGLNALRKEFDIPLPGQPEPPSSGDKPISTVFRALVLEQNGSFFPALAESWEVSDDASSWIFYLDQSILLPNGNPFTSFNVQERFEEWEFVQNGWASVIPIDDYTVEIYVPGGDEFLAERGYLYEGFMGEISKLEFEVQLGQ